MLSWVGDTEELVADQKAPSWEAKVVKAQLQEQKVSETPLWARPGPQGSCQRLGGGAEGGFLTAGRSGQCQWSKRAFRGQCQVGWGQHA